MKQQRKPVDWDELYPGRFLKAGEFLGREVTLTIADIDTEELVSDSGSKVKGVISFKETPKQLPLNKTNGICLREMFGRKLPDWIGKRVTLFPSTWNSEPCVRVFGSPDIPNDMQVTVQLPRRKPFQMTMHSAKRGRREAPREPPPNEPPAEDGDPF